MTRDELIDRTRALVAEGDRLTAAPSLPALREWLRRSDELLAAAWGSMDRYHLAWLMVGKPKGIVRGRPLTPGEEAAEVRDVAAQKTSALRMSLDAVERQGMPFRGETGGIGIGGPSATPAMRVPAARSAEGSGFRRRRTTWPSACGWPASRPRSTPTTMLPARRDPRGCSGERPEPARMTGMAA